MNCYFDECIVIGAGQVVFTCAKYLQDNYRIDCVYEYGGYAQSRLEFLCNKNHISYIKLFDKAHCDKLMTSIGSSKKRTLIVSIANIYIFPQFITKNKNIKIINHHPSFLERHIGRNAEAWAIYEQDKVAGVTWHEVTAEIDHGLILAEKSIELNQTITSIKLRIKEFQIAMELFKEFIGSIMEDVEVSKRMPARYGILHYSYERPNDGILDLDWSGDKISAFLRSMDYGGLNEMGMSFLIDNNLKYSWDSYKILENYSGEYDNSSRIIEKDNTYFVLKNFHIVNSI